VHIDAAGAVIVVMLDGMLMFIGVSGMLLGAFAEMAQSQSRQALQRQTLTFASGQRLAQKTLQIRPDPIEQAGLAQPANVRRAQGKAVRRSPWRQQHGGLTDTLLHRRGDQLQGLDAGEQLNLGTGQLGKNETAAQRQQERNGTHHGEDHGLGGKVI